MKLRPVKASEWVRFNQSHIELLQQGGAVAVNDKLLPLWDLDYFMSLLYGGRGGGKSEALCDLLLHQCMQEKYFKCYYGRKVFDTVRGSCFATLVACIKKNKLEEYFNYSESDSSSMIITCKLNGNKFIPFGSDKPDKLKSIKDPTIIWCEEFDQFAFLDFKNLYPTLRTIRATCRFYASFNTHDVQPDHWILKIFFPDLYEGDDKDDTINAGLLKGKKILKIFINYFDNYFIDQQDYRNVLMLAAAGNLSIFEGIANGEWGININDMPWLFAWARDKHVAKQEIIANKSEILYLSFDFNRNPHACTIMQWPKQVKLQIIEVIKKANVGTEGICEIILAKYPGFLYIITGDYSGNTPSSIYKEQVTNYTVIKKMLKLSDGQIKISPNPPLATNQTLVNSVFYSYPVEVCPVKARPFIFDAENVKKLAEGKIDKTNRDDPKKQADVLDTVRYWINQFMGWFIKSLNNKK